MNKSTDTSQGSISAFIGILTALLVFILFVRTPVDADLWWHLRAGQMMWAQKTILLTDPFSYTRAGMPWVNAFWLSEILFYFLYSFGGHLALAAFVSLIGALTFYLIYHRLAGNPFLNSFVVLLAAITAAPIWGPRPQIISFLIIAALDHWLNSAPRSKWILVPLFVLWANLHGGWIWGCLLLIAHISGQIVKSLSASAEKRKVLWRDATSLIGWSILAGLAVGINPNGLTIWKLPFAQVDVSMQIQEWLSPDFHRLDFHPLLWMMFLLLLAGPFAAKPPNWSQMFKLIGFAYLTFVSQRNIALFAIVAAPVLAEWLNNFVQTLRKQNAKPAHPSLDPNITRAVNILIASCLCFAALAYLVLASRPVEVDKHYPSRAVEWMKDHHPAGRLFNSYNWGGYLLWNLPEYPVFIDGRADLFGHEIISQWQTIMAGGQDGRSLLDSWDIRVIFIEAGTPLAHDLETHGWTVLFQDDMAIILGR